MLKRFWFEFNIENPFDYPAGTAIGCGVTAFDYADALRLLKEKVFKNINMPEVRIVLENVDIRNLDALHVIPNMGPVVLHGIWFPRL